jgi:hypothetical protein
VACPWLHYPDIHHRHKTLNRNTLLAITASLAGCGQLDQRVTRPIALRDVDLGTAIPVLADADGRMSTEHNRPSVGKPRCAKECCESVRHCFHHPSERQETRDKAMFRSRGVNIWDHEMPIRFGGIPLWHRMTVIRLMNDGLVVHSPTRLDIAFRKSFKSSARLLRL